MTNGQAGSGRCLTAEAWVVVARTTRVAVLGARVQAEGDRLVALATGSFYIRPVR
ncbi:MAG TPA: hypothetical protein VFX87_10900 [Methylomirabilota bacterium]|nr:hypothetical protein [Methylomirabilota bacterium]